LAGGGERHHPATTQCPSHAPRAIKRTVGAFLPPPSRSFRPPRARPPPSRRRCYCDLRFAARPVASVAGRVAPCCDGSARAVCLGGSSRVNDARIWGYLAASLVPNGSSAQKLTNVQFVSFWENRLLRHFEHAATADFFHRLRLEQTGGCSTSLQYKLVGESPVFPPAM